MSCGEPFNPNDVLTWREREAYGLQDSGIMSCTCQGCGRKYKLDISIPDEMWEKIKPPNKSIGAGMLCGACITERIEKLEGYGAYDLVETK